MAVRTHESSTKVQSEVVVRRSATQEAMYTGDRMQDTATIEDVKAQVEAQVKSALDEAMMRYREEVAEPQGWWNVYALGPIQATGNWPLCFHIK